MPPLNRSCFHVAAAIGLAACAATPTRPGTESALAASNVPAAIATPGSAKLAFRVRASGLQNYECRLQAGSPAGHDWVFIAPEAALYDKSDMLVGRHYAGPTWEYSDDSKVTGKVLADAPAPLPGNLSWLLLQGTPGPRNGVFSGVTYVQRVNTEGGVAPSDACSGATAGTRKAVRFSADYLFYKG